jgi:uncharacterized small protein (DUF1192 family)
VRWFHCATCSLENGAVTPERQAAIRATLEADDPAFYRPGDLAAKHDYEVKWELLSALDNAQERIALLQEVLERLHREKIPPPDDLMATLEATAPPLCFG